MLAPSAGVGQMGAFEGLPESVGGETPRDGRGQPRTYPPGRFCLEEGCDTQLSIYNKSNYCSIHEAEAPRHPPKISESESP